MKPLQDYRFVRGVCYGGCDDEEQMRRELSYGKRVGLNSIRFWTSAKLYEEQGDAYIESVKRKVQVAYDCGYTSMPILFNGNGMTNDDNPKTLSLEYRKVQEEFCEKMIAALKDEPGLLMWDVMNEPMISYFLQQSPPEKRAERRARVDEFLTYFINFIRERDPVNAITVGYALTSSMEPTVGLCDVISIHNYDRLTCSYNFPEKLSLSFRKSQIHLVSGAEFISCVALFTFKCSVKTYAKYNYVGILSSYCCL